MYHNAMKSIDPYYVSKENGRTWLYHRNDARFKGVGVDFLSDQSLYRMRCGGGRQQAIAKAVGLKKGNRPTVLDATAGLGRDAFVLASLGCRVHMVERSSIIFALLEDGLRRAYNDKNIGPWVQERLSLQQANSGHDDDQWPFVPDVVYLDPMFPPKNKAAKVKKEMQVLQHILDGDPDSQMLLPWALSLAQQRVVIKLPDEAPSFASIDPDTVIKTRKNRFAVYFKKLNTV